MVKVKTLAYWGLIMAILVSENFLYLLDSSQIIKDIGLGIVLIWMVFVLHFYKGCIVTYRFKWFVLFSIVLVITSSIQSNILYGQSVFLGIRPQRYFLIWCMVYFPIRKIVSSKKITYNKLEKLLYRIGIIELVLYIGQYLIGRYCQIIYVQSNNVYSTTRYYTNTIFLCLLLFICLEKVFQKNKIIKNMIIIIFIIFEIIVVAKMRMTFIAVFVACAIGVLLWRKGGYVKLFVVIVSVIGALIVSNTEAVQSIIPTLNDTASLTINSLSIREIGRAFYLDVLSEHPLLGGGYINTQWPAAYTASRVAEGIYWVDNGIFGFAYFYGLLGMAWVVALLIKGYRYAHRLMKSNHIYLFFIMPIYWIVACVSEAHWYFCSYMVVTLLICMLESYLDDFECQGEILKYDS